MTHQHLYKPLATNLSTPPEPRDQSLYANGPLSRFSWGRCISGLAILSLAIVNVWLISVMKIGQNSDIEHEWLGCGYNPVDARNNGCIFDMMMNGWIRPECYNQKLSQEYIKKYHFRIFEDRFGYHELSHDEIRKGDHMVLYTDQSHHLTHCSYVWELQGLALANGSYIDEHSMNYEHTKHCAKLLLTSRELQREPNVGNGTKVPQTVEIGFIRCRSMR